jgi:hypothetical protein
MSYVLRAPALVFITLFSLHLGLLEASAASHQGGYSRENPGKEQLVSSPSRPTAGAPHSSTKKTHGRTCTQVCRKIAPQKYGWGDTESACRSGSEVCSVQAPTSDTSICQSDFDELLTRDGICVPKRNQ